MASIPGSRRLIFHIQRRKFIRFSSSSSSPRVSLDIDEKGIARVCLNRANKRNALDMPMFQAISETAQDLATNPKVRAVVLHGDGPAFCSGLDVSSAFSGDSPLRSTEQLLERPPGKLANLAQNVAMAWREIPAPVICSLHGLAYGGGLQIALGADIRIAAPDCKLCIMESKWGLIPDMGASVLLRELVGIDQAKLLTWTARVITGEEALRLGLVTQVAEDPLDEAMQLAESLVQNSPDALALAKDMYQSTFIDMSEAECLELESDLQRQVLVSWNQVAASSRNFGWKLPYFRHQPKSKL